MSVMMLLLKNYVGKQKVKSLKYRLDVGVINGKFQTNIERKGEPSKWITLKALTVLKNY